jgi:predicted dehydrogenase
VLEVISEGLSIELTERDMRITGAEGPTASSAAVDPYRCEAREFLDAVRHGGSVRVPYGQALATHRVVAAAARSARERAPVELPVLARADG